MKAVMKSIRNEIQCLEERLAAKSIRDGNPEKWMALSKQERFKLLPKLKTLKYEWITTVKDWILPYFHNYEYKHSLRGIPDRMSHLGINEWDVLYDQIATDLKNAGLPLDGYSKEHSKIIADALGTTTKSVGYPKS